jgi:hypothetical protein
MFGLGYLTWNIRPGISGEQAWGIEVENLLVEKLREKWGDRGGFDSESV